MVLSTAFNHGANNWTGGIVSSLDDVFTVDMGTSHCTLPVTGSVVYESGSVDVIFRLHEFSNPVKDGNVTLSSGCCIMVMLEPWKESFDVVEEVLWSMLSIAAVVKTPVAKLTGTTWPID